MRRIDLFDGRVIPAERVAIGRLLGLLSDVVVRVATTPEVLRCLQVEAAEDLGVRESIDRRGVNVDACRGEPVIRVAVSEGAVGAEHCRGVRAAAGGRLAHERLGGKALIVAEGVSRGGGGRLLRRNAPLPHADAALTTGERRIRLPLQATEGAVRDLCGARDACSHALPGGRIPQGTYAALQKGLKRRTLWEAGREKRCVSWCKRLGLTDRPTCAFRER